MDGVSDLARLESRQSVGTWLVGGWEVRVFFLCDKLRIQVVKFVEITILVVFKANAVFDQFRLRQFIESGQGDRV